MVGVKRETSPTTSFCETTQKSPTKTEKKKKDGRLLGSNKIDYSALSQASSLISPEKTQYLQEEEQEADGDGKPKIDIIKPPNTIVGKFEDQERLQVDKVKQEVKSEEGSTDEKKDIAVGSDVATESTARTVEKHSANSKCRKASSKKQNDRTATNWRKMPLTR